ncbi:hypothetical protein OfM2_08410 [Lactovum odontotermitis]
MSYQHQKKKLSDKSNTHYRTWKKGKSWCYGFSVLAALAGGMILASQTVNADLSDVAASATSSSATSQIPEITPVTETTVLEGTDSTVTPASLPESPVQALSTELPAADGTIFENTTLTPETEEPQAAITSSSPAIFSAAAATNVISSNIELTVSNSTEPLSRNQTLSSTSSTTMGGMGSFTVDVSDLKKDNNIVIAQVLQTSTDPSDAMVSLESVGTPSPVKIDGQTIGTIQFVPNEEGGGGAIVLKVNADVSGTGEKSADFTAQNLISLNHNTPTAVRGKMPFENTISVSGNDYNFSFTSVTTDDATKLPIDNSSLNNNNSSGTAFSSSNFHQTIPDDDAFKELQNSNGADGTLLDNVGDMNSFRVSSENAIRELSQASLSVGVYYVSAETGKVQTVSPSTTAYKTKNRSRGLGKTILHQCEASNLADLQAQARNGGTGVYYTKQGNDYLVVEYISPEDMILTEDEIRASIEESSLAASSEDLEADVQATLEFYQNLGNRASYTDMYTVVGWADPDIPNTIKVDKLDDNGNAINKDPFTSTTTPNTSVIAGQSTIKVHYVDEQGNPLDVVETTLGWPEGNAVGHEADPDLEIGPKTISGYSYSTVKEKDWGDDGTAYPNTNGSVSVAFPADGATTDIFYIYTANQQKVVYNVIDETTGVNLESNVPYATGPSNSNTSDYLATPDKDLDAIIKDYTDQGYIWDYTEPANGYAVFDSDDNATQLITIYLKHDIEETTETSVVKENVNYIYKDGTPTGEPDHTDSVTFSRTVSTDHTLEKQDPNNYKPSYGAWEVTEGDPTFDAKQSPEIKGYTPDIAEVGETVVTGDSEDIIQTVVYSADPQKIVYTVIDDTTGENKEENIVFDEGNTSGALTRPQEELQAIADGYIDDGYKVEKVDTLPESFDDDAATDQIVYIHLVHDTEDVLESKEVDETIHYVYEDGTEAAEDHTDKVTFTRTNTTDKVTGEVISSTDWIAENDDTVFDAVTSPEIDGYTADKLSVDAVTGLTQDSANTEVTVTYTKDAEEPAPTPEATDDTPTAPSSTPKASISVQPTSQTTKKVLPSTGDEERSTVAAAGGLIVLGAGLLGVIRHLRRKKQ